jgi:hypothetical protein
MVTPLSLATTDYGNCRVHGAAADPNDHHFPRQLGTDRSGWAAASAAASSRSLVFEVLLSLIDLRLAQIELIAVDVRFPDVGNRGCAGDLQNQGEIDQKERLGCPRRWRALRNPAPLLKVLCYVPH